MIPNLNVVTQVSATAKDCMVTYAAPIANPDTCFNNHAMAQNDILAEDGISMNGCRWRLGHGVILSVYSCLLKDVCAMISAQPCLGKIGWSGVFFAS